MMYIANYWPRAVAWGMPDGCGSTKMRENSVGPETT